MSIDHAAERTSGWRRLRLGDVLQLNNGRAFKSAEWGKSGRPIIRIQNLKSATASFNYFSGDLPDRFAARDGDLLFAWSGTPGTSFGAHIWRGPDAWVNQHIFRVDFSPDDFEPEFLKLALTANLATYIDQAQGGVGLAHITKAKLNDSTLLAPPLDVQRAVVALLGDIEIGVTAARTQIAAATRSVERFRAAVLAAACSGRLTADWREAHPDLRAAEITPSSAVVLPLFDAPENWQWSSLDSITDIRGGIQVGAKTRDGANLREVPYLRVANVQRGWLDLSEVKKIAAPEDKIAALRLQPGDIFFNEGGDRDKLGRGWIWEGQIDECIHQNHVFRARLHNPAFEPRFYSWFGNSFGTRYFIDEGKQTVNLASLSKKRLERLPVPVPPPEEQSEIVRRVDALLAIADRLTSQVEGIAATVARVSGATLAKALRGELISTEASLAAEPRRGFGSPQKLVEHVEATRESSSHTSRRRAKA